MLLLSTQFHCPDGFCAFSNSTSTRGSLRTPFRVFTTLLASGVLMLGEVGCATQFRFKVDALRGPEPSAPNRSFVLRVSGNRGAPNEEAFQEIAARMRAALFARGMFEAPASVPPDIAVDIDFSVTGPYKVYRAQTVPVYASPPPISIPTGARISNEPVNIPVKRSTPVQIGERTEIQAISAFRKTLRLTARNIRRSTDGPAPELWSVSVSNDDTSGDSRLYARLMTVAAIQLMDHNTGSAREVVLGKRDAPALPVERGIPRRIAGTSLTANERPRPSFPE